MEIKKRIFLISIAFLFLSALAFSQPRGGNGGGGRSPSGGKNRTAPFRSSSKKSTGSGKTNTQAFNGMRLSGEHDPFQVVQIVVKKDSIVITFNIPIDNATFAAKNIFMNENSLDKAAKIKFNKTGKIVEIKKTIEKGVDFILEFKDVKSYDGETLAIAKFDSLSQGIKKEFPVIKRGDSEDSQKGNAE